MRRTSSTSTTRPRRRWIHGWQKHGAIPAARIRQSFEPALGRAGRRAGRRAARPQVAELLNAEPDEIVFTGSGTEADNMALSAWSRMCRTGVPRHHQRDRTPGGPGNAALLERRGVEVTLICRSTARASSIRTTLRSAASRRRGWSRSWRPITSSAPCSRSPSWPHQPARTARCFTPMPCRPPARFRWMWSACRSICCRSRRINSTAPRASARCSCARVSTHAAGPWRRSGARPAVGHRERGGHRRDSGSAAEIARLEMADEAAGW